LGKREKHFKKGLVLLEHPDKSARDRHQRKNAFGGGLPIKKSERKGGGGITGGRGISGAIEPLKTIGELMVGGKAVGKKMGDGG